MDRVLCAVVLCDSRVHGRKGSHVFKAPVAVVTTINISLAQWESQRKFERGVEQKVDDDKHGRRQEFMQPVLALFAVCCTVSLIIAASPASQPSDFLLRKLR